MIRRPSRFRRVVIACVLVTLIVVGLAWPVAAQFVVIDPAVLGNAVSQLIQLELAYSELVQTYQQIRNQYSLLQQQAQGLPVNMNVRYRTTASPWLPFTAATAYGLTTGWIAAANTGQGASGGYTRATQTLQPYGGAIQQLSPEEAARVEGRVDRLDLGDGAVVHGVAAVGAQRAREVTVESALENLESDTFSSNSDFNTQIAVLNKISATDVTAARLASDTNNLLVSLVEQQVLDATERREAAVEGINAHIAFETETPALLAASTSQTTTALTTFRIP
jgi:hypothetical protein